MLKRPFGAAATPRRRSFLAVSSISLVAVLIIAISSAVAGSVGTTAGFEDDDGNLAAQPGINFDWNSFSPTVWNPHPVSTPTRTADATAGGWTFKGIEDRQASTSDSGFAGGVKQDDDCASVISQKADNKADLKRIYLASKTGSNGHTYLMLSWLRIPQNTTSPSAHIAFEFNQGTTACGSGGLVRRTAGDMLVLYDFEGGSTDAPTIRLARWITSGACEVASNVPPCWGVANALPAGVAEAKVNTFGAVTDTNAPPALSSNTGASVSESLGTSEFGEAGIDLTLANVFPAGRCVTFGKAYGVSRTSGNSGTAQMKDLVGPANFNLTNCGRIKIIKRTNPRGINQAFGFTSTLAADGSSTAVDQVCTQDTTPAAFSVNDAGNTTSDSAANTESCTNVPAGTYTVTEGSDPANFGFADLSCTSSGTGTSATPSSGNSTKTASITLGGGGVVTCTYTNRQLLGAIQVTKTRKHAATGSGDYPQAGVTFTARQNGAAVATGQTDANGKVCFGNLPFGSYTVRETVPAGYHVDGNDKAVTVDSTATCSGSPYAGESVGFRNMPLTNITVTVDSQIAGGTKSTIDCDAATAGTNAGPGDDISYSLNDKEPGIYTCVIDVDP